MTPEDEYEPEWKALGILICVASAISVIALAAYLIHSAMNDLKASAFRVGCLDAGNTIADCRKAAIEHMKRGKV